MAKKKKLKAQLIFNIANTIILLFFVGFYTYRLLYYYNLENGKESQTEVALADELLKHISQIDLSNGLVQIHDEYVFKGESKNNYVNYSNRLWRIIGIDVDKNVKMILEKSETSIPLTGTADYKNDSLRLYLNPLEGKSYSGYYYNTLNSQSQYLEKTYLCADKIDDVKNITCNSFFGEDYITLLSLDDYKEIGGTQSYLNNGTSFWLGTSNNSSKYWYVAEDGGLSVEEMGLSYGIRPVITLRNTTTVISGEGSKNNPFIIENKKIVTLADADIAKYVTYSNQNWKIINKNDNSIQLALDGYIKVDDKEVVYQYAPSKNTFTNTKKTIGYYLNNDYYKTLENKDYLVKSPWYYGKYTEYNTYDYSKVYSNNYKAYVGLLKIGDLYVNEYKDVFLLTRPYGDSNLIFSISESGNYFTDFVNTKLKIRPSIYLKNDLNIASGEGSKTSPYVLEVKSDE